MFETMNKTIRMAQLWQRFLVVLALVLSCMSVVVCGDDYGIGVKEAEHDLAADCAGVYIWGDRDVWSGYDVKTGLLYIDIYMRHTDGLNLKELQAGYNNTVNEYIRKKGYPANSRKKWEYIMENPHSYQMKLKREDLVKIGKGASSAKIATGQYLVDIRKDTKDGIHYLWVYTKENHDKAARISPVDPNSEHSIFLGSDGSRLLIIEVNSQDVKSVWYIIGLPEFSRLRRIGGH